MQNDYSVLNRRVEENGLSEASSPLHENTGAGLGVAYSCI